MAQKTIQKIYPLSPLQQGMLFHSIKSKDSNAYFEQTTLTLEGVVSPDILEQSYQALIERHEALRTLFVYEGVEEMIQVVVDHLEFTLHFEDISNLSEPDQQTYLERFKASDIRQGFDISRKSLMRAALFQLEPCKYQLVWSHHHLIMDGWSFGVAISELLQIYRGKRMQQEVSLPPVYPYSDFIHWLGDRDRSQGLRYWEQYTKGYDTLATFPKVASISPEYKKHEIIHSIPPSLLESIEQIAKSNNTTLNILLQSVWALLLQKYNYTDDVLFGSIVSGRSANIYGIEQMVGMFINTIPIRAKQTEQDQRFVDWIRQLQALDMESRQHDYVPLYEIQSLSELRNGLFDHILVFENYPIPDEIHQFASSGELGFRIIALDHFDQTNYDLNVTFMPMEGMRIVFSYNAEVYAQEFINQLGRNFVNMLSEVAADPEVRIHRISLLSAEEQEHMIHEMNRNHAAYPEDRLIYEYIEEQAELEPERIALIYKEESMTYKSLNQRSNMLAHHLRNKGIGTEDVIGVLLDRGLDMFVAVLGIWKAGAAYVPIDPDYPMERQQLLLENSKAKQLITSLELADRLPGTVDHIYISNLDGPTNNLDRVQHKENLAYVIYTSGTTGTPKGVMVTHESLLNACFAWKQEYRLSEFPVTLLQIASFAFDVFVGDLARSLPNGGTVVICPSEARLSPDSLADLIEYHRITLLESTPALLIPLMDYVYEEKRDVSSLELLILGSDICTIRDFQRILERFGDRLRILNSYGVTEACIDTCCYEAGGADRLPAANLPIGKPLPNMELYVLDEYMNPLPYGVTGELYIGGAGVARGYMFQPELTDKKFIPHPFKKGAKLYRTGDLARWLTDGNLEFLGRTDFQVKIRGYRIETGEVENAILSYSGVKEAVVAVKMNHSHSGIMGAYFTCDEEVSEIQIMDYLQTKLPPYMIPTFLFRMDKLPLTPNGKIDRKSLPDIELSLLRSDYVEPRSLLELQLQEVWMEVLKVDRIGVYDDFYQLGGHSLTATAIIGKIHKRLDVKIPIPVFFRCLTIDKLAQWIQSQAGQNRFEAIMPAEARSYYPLSSAQKRMLILNKLETEQPVYNMTGAFRIYGKLDIEQFSRAWNTLIQRHESLRTSVTWLDGNPVQEIRSIPELIWEAEKLAEESIDIWCQSFVRSFDLQKDTLIRIGLAQLEETEFLLIVDIHHLIADGVSLDILVTEFMALYQGARLPELTLQYKDFAVWQQAYFATPAYQEQEQYWLQSIQGDIPLLDLPTDFKRSPVRSFEGERLVVTVSPSLTGKLHRLSRETGTTLYGTLLSAYYVLLHKYTGQDDIIVGSPVTGRTHPDLKSMIGLFVNTLPIRNQVRSEDSFLDLQAQVKERLLQAYEHQDYPLEELVGKLEIRRDTGRNPLFDTVFVMQNTENVNFELDEMTVEPYEFGQIWAKFDLTVESIESGGTIILNFEYNSNLFKSKTIERMANHYVHLLEEVTASSQQLIGELDILSPMEREAWLPGYAYVERANSYPETATIHQLFELQAERFPDRIALVHRERSMTYQELNEEANQLAVDLRNRGVVANITVAVMAEPSFDMFIAMLAVLKSGGAFIPIDPQYPKERIRYILEESKTALCLTHTHLMFTSDGIEMLDISAKSNMKNDTQITKNLPPCNQSDDLAYVIYTSGSTGAPKGVMVEHRSLLNLCEWHLENYRITERDRAAKYAAFGFDASIWEVFPYLICGASIAVIDSDIRLDMAKLSQYFSEQQISVAFLPTHVCEQFFDYHVPSLRILLTGGDKLNAWKPVPYQLYNNYGPTENTVVTTSCLIDRGHENIPIGKPIHNVRVYVLDPNLKMVPMGAIGELCISGTGLARGYINNPELTREKFIPNPFIPGERLYRTGDLVRISFDGNIEFVSRLDSQVKILGSRIELGEIETALLKHPNISEAVVIDLENAQGQKYLAAYVTSHTIVDTSALRRNLLQSLPGYMVPQVVMQIDMLPLTPNGKVDRKLLPVPDLIDQEAELYVPPGTALEKLLVSIWQETLGIEPIGIHHNFFGMGGNSIQSIQVVNRLHQEGYRLDMQHFFQYPTIHEVCRFIEPREDWSEAAGGERMFPLLPSQVRALQNMKRRMYSSVPFNMLYSSSGFDEQALYRAIAAVVGRHDVFELVFVQSRDSWMQYFDKDKVQRYSLEVRLLAGNEELSVIVRDDIVRMLSSMIPERPHLQLALFRTDLGEEHLAILAHPAVMDQASVDICTTELIRLYKQFKEEQEVSETVASGDYRQWLTDALRSSEVMVGEDEPASSVVAAAMEDISELDALASGSTSSVVETANLAWDSQITENYAAEAKRAYNLDLHEMLWIGASLATFDWSGSHDSPIVFEREMRQEANQDLGDIDLSMGIHRELYLYCPEEKERLLTLALMKRMKEAIRQMPMVPEWAGSGNAYDQLHNRNYVECSYREQRSDSTWHKSHCTELVEERLLATSESAVSLRFSYGSDGLNLKLCLQSEASREGGIQLLAERIQTRLEQIYEHCLELKHTEWTPSDVNADMLSIEDLDEISKIFG
ncbi:amino acid adenylation domain-containing protein [Paenibacillus lentus]|uniref:amino acid adenylation domain-containing protein n=1 Tax=Paenibacillus lentus TaxID=1338368 RepID=UPI003650A08E